MKTYYVDDAKSFQDGAELAEKVQVMINGEVHNDDPDVKRVRVEILENASGAPVAQSSFTSDFDVVLSKRSFIQADGAGGFLVHQNQSSVFIHTSEPRSEIGVTKPLIVYLADADRVGTGPEFAALINEAVETNIANNPSFVDHEVVRLSWVYVADGGFATLKDAYFLLFN